MTKKRVYIESSVVSYLTANEPKDIQRQAKQDSTISWWKVRNMFELHISSLVLDEIRRGDPEAARKRLDVVAEINVLGSNPDVEIIATSLLQTQAVPQKAEQDAVHIALAAVHGMDFLLTWNQTHIANAIKRRHIEDVVHACRFVPSIVITPEELLWEVNHGLF